jgi:hypothetical protein
MMKSKPDAPQGPPVKPIPKTPPRMSAAKPEKKGMFSFLSRKKNGPGPVGQPPEPPKEQKPKKDILRPFKEELTYEWKWLLKKLHIYDYDKEEANLAAYRKLRGWDK